MPLSTFSVLCMKIHGDHGPLPSLPMPMLEDVWVLENLLSSRLKHYTTIIIQHQ